MWRATRKSMLKLMMWKWHVICLRMRPDFIIFNQILFYSQIPNGPSQNPNFPSILRHMLIGIYHKFVNNNLI